MTSVILYATEENLHICLVNQRHLAERAGFEPALRFPVNTLSRRAPSTTRPPLRLSIFAAAGFAARVGEMRLPSGIPVRNSAPWAPSTSGHPFPAPEPSKQQARGSSSRSGAECQDITALYSLCRTGMLCPCHQCCLGSRSPRSAAVTLPTGASVAQNRRRGFTSRVAIADKAGRSYLSGRYRHF